MNDKRGVSMMELQWEPDQLVFENIMCALITI